MGIDLDGPEPLRDQVAADLTRRIDAGEITKRLPSSAALSDEYGVSRRTIVDALRLLRESGKVIGVPGRGTFVADG